MEAHQQLAIVTAKKVVFSMIILFSIIVIDILTKKYALALLSNGIEEISIISFLKIVHYRNSGIAFGLLSYGHIEPIIIVTIQLTIVGLLYFSLTISNDWTVYVPISLIMGGGVANAYDRFMNDAVLDFILFHFGKYKIPAFNLADISIMSGLFMLLFVVYVYKKDDSI